MVEELRQKLSEIQAVCAEFEVEKLDVIGSAARGDFDSARSDFDFLVTFRRKRRLGFGGTYMEMLASLEGLLGRKVHLIEEAAQDERFLKYATRDRQSLYAA